MSFDPNILAEFLQIRIWLESSVIGEAVTQIKARDIAQLDAVMAIWAKRVETGQPYADLDEQFHRILYTTLNNQTLMKLFEVFWIAFQNLDFETIQVSEPAVELEEHRRILEAVKEGDVTLTRQRLVQHFSRLQDRLRRVIGAGEAAPRISSRD
jgi:DNA-binding FadR family transcriptional regulator